MRLSRRHLLAGAAAASVLAGCAAPQTLIPYTPAAGVNNGPNAANLNPGDDRLVIVRNLLIVETAKGTGFLSGSLIARNEPVSLRDVTGAPVVADGSPGTPFVVSGGTRLDIPANQIVVLTDKPAITLRSPNLVAGFTADVVLTFDKGDPVRLRVPVYSNTNPDFATIKPKS